jgi:hypothetical protein
MRKTDEGTLFNLRRESLLAHLYAISDGGP